MQKIILIATLLIPLMLIAPQFSFGDWEPPTPKEEKLVGPTIDVVLGLKNITIGGTNYVSLLLSGICNGAPFSRYQADFRPGNVAGIEAGDLIDARLDIEGICNNNVKYALVCISVKSFVKNALVDADMAIAEVVAVFVVPIIK